MSGTVAAQVVSLLALPLLSRIYAPADFGVFSFVLAVTAVLAPIAGLRLETAAMLPQDTTGVRAIVRACMTSIILFACGTVVVIELIRALGGIDATVDFPYLGVWVGVLVLLTALFSLMSQLALRDHRYQSVAARTLLQSSGTAVSQLGFGLVLRNAGGLLLGHAIGRAIGIIPLWRETRQYFGAVSTDARRNVWRDYWRFPAVFAPSALLNALGTQAPVIFVVAWFGVDAGGQVGMAERIVGLPLVLVGAAAGQVLEAEVAKRLREGAQGMRSIYWRVSAMLGGLAAIAALGFGILGGWLVPILLGAQWQDAGAAVQIMAMAAGIRLVGSPLSKFILLYQRSLANTVLDLVRVLLVGGAFAATMLLKMPLFPALWLIYTALALTYLITWVYGLVLTGRAPEQLRISEPRA
ncbi:MAG: lipopolysaccharide biosynthesis protein [Microbacterium sp.]|jgi:O-antigen/teichoic acid export membrane protein|nr:lipopolysaccharide biosynthesis protein [Microbacterium sp.]